MPDAAPQNSTSELDIKLPLKPNDEKPRLPTALLGLLSYVHVLFLVPFLTSVPGSFERFHAVNGGALFAASSLGMFLGTLLPASLGSIIFSAAVLMQLILAIIGTQNILLGKREGLPLLGKYVERFTTSA